MKRQDQLVGAIGLTMEVAAFVMYCTGFTIARIGIGTITLPLSHRFVQPLLVLLLAGFILGCLGAFMDGKRRSAHVALAFFLPALIIMGVLAGHF